MSDLFLDHECADVAAVLALVLANPVLKPSQYLTFLEPHCGCSCSELGLGVVCTGGGLGCWRVLPVVGMAAEGDVSAERFD